MGPIGVPEIVAVAGYALIGYVIYRFLRALAGADQQK